MKEKPSYFFYENSESIAYFSDFTSHLKIRFISIYKKLIDIDYYFYTVKILQSLPEALIIVYLGFLAVYNLLKYSENSHGNKIFPITTTSMYPYIRPGSLVFTNRSLSYKNGDIISFTEKTQYGINTGKILTHRIIGEDESGNFITKGDANQDADPNKVKTSQIQGKIVRVLPVLGYLEVLLKTIPGFLVMVMLPSLILIKNRVNEMKIFSKAH